MDDRTSTTLPTRTIRGAACNGAGPRDPPAKAQFFRAQAARLPYNAVRIGPNGGGVVAQAAGITEFDDMGDLLLATGRGEQPAFAHLYNLSSPILFAIALRTLRRRELAEEVLQESYLSIWKKAGQYHPARGRALAWMITIVRNRAIDRLRAEGRLGDRLEGLEDDSVSSRAANVVEPSIPGHLAQTVRGCIEQLQNNYRKSILLAYYYGLTHEELAARLETPLGTVKSWVRRGLHQLKGCVEQ